MPTRFSKLNESAGESSPFSGRLALTNPNYIYHPDIAGGMHKVHRHKYQFARDDSHPMVTIVECQGEPLVMDGDKTAIAAYLYALKMGQVDFILPVYYISPPLPPSSPTQQAKAGP